MMIIVTGAIARVVADTVRVSVTSMPHTATAQERWLQLLAPTLIGGFLAILGGYLAQRRGERVLDKRNRIIVERRLEHLLTSVVSFADSQLSLSPLAKLGEGVCAELLESARAFDRVADHLVLLGDPKFEGAALVFSNGVRIYVTEARAQGKQLEERGSEITRDEVLEFRKKVNDLFAELREKAYELDERFNRLRKSAKAIPLDAKEQQGQGPRDEARPSGKKL